jgi:hypothetical protein
MQRIGLSGALQKWVVINLTYNLWEFRRYVVTWAVFYTKRKIVLEFYFIVRVYHDYFKKAYDSVSRKALHNILIEFGIPIKLVRLIKIVWMKRIAESG